MDHSITSRAGVAVARTPHTPAVSVAIALATGIAFDRFTIAPPWLWAVLAAAGLAVACCSHQPGRRHALAVLVTCAAIGALRHHGFVWLRALPTIRDFADRTAQPVEVIGRIVSPVVVTTDDDPMTPEWMRGERSTCTIECEALISGDARILTSGRVELIIDDGLPELRVGQRLLARGRMERPTPQQSPGGFDYQRTLRARGVDVVVHSGAADYIEFLSFRPRLSERLSRSRERLREACRSVFRQHLSPRTAPVAASLLLGDRNDLPDDVRRAFINSGTMHLLAISGLHVGILAGLLLLMCRIGNLSPGMTALVIVAAILTFAWVTDLRPPVIRAAVLATIAAASIPWSRPYSSLNTIGLTAVVLLLWKPAELFSVGAQLSFLAVLGIVKASELLNWWSRQRDPTQEHLRPEAGPLWNVIRRAAGAIGRMYVLMAGVWLFTLPLTIAAFHVVSPIGLVVNIMLIPYTTLTLAFGFATLAIGLIAPSVAFVPGTAFDLLLRVLLWVVEKGAATPLGHSFAPAPPMWWLVVFYTLLAVASGIIRLPARVLLTWQIVFGWVVLGLLLPFSSGATDTLTMTVLPVGHGGATLIALPDGRTLLYDAGTLGRPGRVSGTVRDALSDAGRSRIDAVIVSHADIDHFNGLPELMNDVRVGSLLVSQPFLRRDAESVASLVDAAADAGVPVRIVVAGDRIVADRRVSIAVLHPPSGAGESSDNANSIVLRIDYAGRSLLLPGDLEGSGTRQLLERSPEPVDVLLAPHHGSRAANPPDFVNALRPDVVIVSSNHPPREELKAAYPDARLLSTDGSGAVTVQIDGEGALRVAEFMRSDE